MMNLMLIYYTLETLFDVSNNCYIDSHNKNCVRITPNKVDWSTMCTGNLKLKNCMHHYLLEDFFNRH